MEQELEHVYEPPTVEGAPTILLLHGKGESKETMLERGRRLYPGAGLLSVQGQVQDEHGYRRHFAKHPDGSFDEEDLLRRSRALDAFLHTAAERYHFVVRELLAVGYSNGSNMLCHLATQHPELFTGVALWRPIKPYAFPDNLDVKGVHFLINAGAHDKPVLKDLDALQAGLESAGGEVAVNIITKAGHGLLEEDLAVTRLWIQEVLRRKTAER